MSINFSYGYYINGRLCQISADINVSLDYYKNLKKLLYIRNVLGVPLARVGMQNRDGGYVMLADLHAGGIAYSFGINNDVSWDNTMADVGYDVYMYDHTIDKLPQERKEFNFFKKGIAGQKLSKPEGELNSLKNYIKENGHSDLNNMILKMDVEGAEWDFLETVETKTLKQFDQIAFEFHNLIKPEYGERILKLLKKLNRTHQLIHLHGNNSSYQLQIGGFTFTDVIECTYVLKDKYVFYDNDNIVLPTSYDRPNDMGRPDVFLGKWNQPMSED